MIYSLFLLGDVFKEGFIGIILILDTLIYGLIGSAFRVFMAIASARLLSSEAYYAIANKVYLIIGVLMLFVLSYGILKAIVNPDEGTKQMGPGLLKKIAIAVVGLAVTPALFTLMYQAQGLVLEHDVLAKLFFRSESTDKIVTGGSVPIGDSSMPIDDNINPDDFVKTIGGSYTATTIWQAFFYPAPDSGLTADEIKADPSDYYIKAAGWGAVCGGIAVGGAIAIANGWNPAGWVIGLGVAAIALTCGLAYSNYDAAETGTAISEDEISLKEAYALTAAGESFGLYTIFLDNYLDDGEISYLFGVSTLCGAFALYAFASFSIDMGIRAAKLAYFQVIAPIPLVMQILPGKDGVFKDYTKKVIHTFLEVFIRISVVYIVIYLICHLQDLFSSADALWGNTDLSTPELMFAIAFLVIGLIIFCKEAPKFFGETLGINSGNMSLGLRKKLAEGGAYNAAGVAYGGLTSAVRNWRNYKSPNGRNNLLGRIGSTVAGLGSGAARAAKSQMIGPDKHQSMNWRDAKNAGERAAQGATDKRDERFARRTEEYEARQQIAQAEADIATQEAALAQAIRTGDAAAQQQARQRIAEARQNLEDAQRRLWHATAVGTAIDNTQRKLDSWSLGSVSLEQEEADLKFASGLKKLRDEARDEAYKKSQTAKAFKQQMERLQATEISEYREGWDEESFNEAVRNRIANEMSALNSAQNARATARTARDAAQAALTAAQATNNAAAIAAAQADLTARENDLAAAETLENTRIAELNTARQEAIVDIGRVAKRDEREIGQERVRLQREIQQSKELMEAAADAWVAEQFGDAGSDVTRIYQEFLNNNSDYISKNSSRAINPNSQTTVAQMLSDFANVRDNVVDTTQAVQNSNYVMTINGTTTTFTRNTNGTYSGGGLNNVSVEELFQHVSEQMKGQANTKFEASTSSTRSSRAGKEAAEQIPVSENYRDKVRRKRQAEDAKSGRK